MTGTRRLTVSRLSLATGYPNRTEKCTSQDHLTAGGASWGSKLAPCSFYLVPVTREVTTTKPKNHLHKLLYKTFLPGAAPPPRPPKAPPASPKTFPRPYTNPAATLSTPRPVPCVLPCWPTPIPAPPRTSRSPLNPLAGAPDSPSPPPSATRPAACPHGSDTTDTCSSDTASASPDQA